MDWDKKALRVGAVALAAAVLFRFASTGGFGTLTRALTSPEFAAAVIFLETGRTVKPGQAPTQPAPTEQTTAPTQPTETVVQTTAPEETAVAVFSQEDAELVTVNSVCGYDADVQDLLEKPLSWELKSDEPTVLIVHSHATESYKGTTGYRSKSVKKNVVSIGTAVKKALEKEGVQVVHDKTLHDSPSYNDAYNNARESIEKHLKKYPSIQLVLDIHRDSVVDENGKQVKFNLEGTSVAQLMLVVGTDAGGLTHPDWKSNMALAVKLHAQLEKNTPGICRAISFRSQRFNQDLSPGALIVEVGSAGNSRKEALAAAELLSQAVLDLAQGTG